MVDYKTELVHPFYDTTSLSTTLGSIRFTTANNEGRIDAYNGSTLSWSFPVGSRIYSAPIEANGNIYFGANDGYVYCLSKADGHQIWRFHVGPSERTVVAFSEVESSHPIFGVTLHNGVLYASAGRTVEGDHGIYVVGLNPQTGAVVSKLNFYTYREWKSLKGTLDRNAMLASRPKLINGPVQSIDNSTTLQIQFWDNATGTSGGMYGVNGWQTFIFNSSLTGVIDPATMQTVNISFIPSKANQGTSRIPANKCISLIGTKGIKLQGQGMYNLTIIDGLGRKVAKQRILSQGNGIYKLDAATKAYFLNFSK